MGMYLGLRFSAPVVEGGLVVVAVLAFSFEVEDLGCISNSLISSSSSCCLMIEKRSERGEQWSVSNL